MHRGTAVAAFSIVALLAFGGAAYAGVLPAPIQRAVSDVARQVGVAVPSSQTASRAAVTGLDRSVGHRGIGNPVGTPKVVGGGSHATGTAEPRSIETTKTPGVGKPRSNKGHRLKAKTPKATHANTGRASARTKVHKSTSTVKKPKAKSNRGAASDHTVMAAPGGTRKAKGRGDEGKH
jgi:hypothetical protein